MVGDPNCPKFTYEQGAGGDYGEASGIFVNKQHVIVNTYRGSEIIAVDSQGCVDYDTIAEITVYRELYKEFNG